MKIAVVTSRFPFPLEKGDKLRLYFQIKHLASKHEIILISLADSPVADDSLKHIQSFCSSVFVFPIKKNAAIFNVVKTLFDKKPLEVNYFFNKKIKAKIEDILRKERPDHIFCQLIRMSEYVKDLPYPKTVDYMDAFSLGMERRAENSNIFLKLLLKRDASQIADYEEVIFKKFQNHTIISQQDKDQMPIPEKEKIHVLPNGVDTHFFAPMATVKKEFDITFVGNMGYYPNVQAAVFIAKKILPKLILKYPKIKIQIAGARPTPQVKSLASKNIKITGWVEDIRTAYAAAKIFVAPIFHGRGQQNKILEAMAMGIPCITTDQVNQAIGATNGESILIGNDAESCLEQISLLLENSKLQAQLSANALQFVRKNYSWEKCGEQLEKIFVSNS